MADISTIPRLPADGAQDDSGNFSEPQNIERDRSSRPSTNTLHDEATESGKLSNSGE